MTRKSSSGQSQLPPFRSVFITSFILIFIGLAGLVMLFLFTLPTLGPRWLLFFLVTLVCCGLALPVAFYLNKRFPSKPPADAAVLIREALWFGIYIDLILWLQFGKVLNFALALFIGIGLGAVELLIRLRERSQFTPSATRNE